MSYFLLSNTELKFLLKIILQKVKKEILCSLGNSNELKTSIKSIIYSILTVFSNYSF